MRHLIDGARTRKGERLTRFVSAERRAKITRQLESLRRAPKRLDPSVRLARFLRIDARN